MSAAILQKAEAGREDGLEDALGRAERLGLPGVVDADARTRRLAAFNALTGELVWSAILPGKEGAPIGAPTIDPR